MHFKPPSTSPAPSSDTDPEARLRDQLERAVASAGLATGCAGVAVYVDDDRPIVQSLAVHGRVATSCSIDDYRCVTGLMPDGGDDVFILNDALMDPSPAARTAFVLKAPSSPRFVAFVRVRDEVGHAIGLLVVSDPQPRSGLSAARTYVLRALACQIADSLALRDIKLRVADTGGERLRLLESVVVHAKDSILITEAEPFDLPGPRIVYCNAAFTETTGYAQEEVLGKTPRILQGVDTDPMSRAKIRAALAQWRPIEIEVLNYRKDGTPFWVELSIVPVADERGWYTHWVSVQRDVTDRKAAVEVEIRARMAEANNEALQALTNELRLALDAAEAANIAKTQFLANMSHEIRTPLNGVLGMAQALWMDELTPVQRDRLSIIRDSGASLLAVLNDVLDISKIEAGRLEIEMTEFDLQSVVAGVCGAFTEQANRKGVSFGMTLAEDTRGLWRGDSVRLRQILYNLISNALKFTSQGEVRVSLEVVAPDQLTLRVMDTGIGIPVDKVDALFSKFYQGDSSITRRFGGTGLGLSICRQLCELLGGTIGVETAAGEGSTFTVVIPMQQLGMVSMARDVATPSNDATVSDTHGFEVCDLRVLVAEDNRANQLVMRALLQAFSVTPVIVGNGCLAVAACETATFDLILMDVQMPEMDGVTATRHIRDREVAHGLPTTPIIAVSANAMTHQIQEYLGSGMDGHLPKPLDIGQLAAVLARFAGQDAFGDTALAVSDDSNRAIA